MFFAAPSEISDGAAFCLAQDHAGPQRTGAQPRRTGSQRHAGCADTCTGRRQQIHVLRGRTGHRA
jgi:hypothetical protein